MVPLHCCCWEEPWCQPGKLQALDRVFPRNIKRAMCTILCCLCFVGPRWGLTRRGAKNLRTPPPWKPDGKDCEVEIGNRRQTDCKDTLRLSIDYNSAVFASRCNPHAHIIVPLITIRIARREKIHRRETLAHTPSRSHHAVVDAENPTNYTYHIVAIKMLCE